MRIVKALTVAVVAALFASPGASAQAETFTFTEKTPFVTDVFTCDGSFVTVEGTAHFVDHITFDASTGLHQHIGFFTLSNVKGTSETGETFVLVGGSEFAINFTSSGASTFTSKTTAIALTRGPDNNVFLQRMFHFTTNANGEPTGVGVHFDADCR